MKFFIALNLVIAGLLFGIYIGRVKAQESERLAIYDCTEHDDGRYVWRACIMYDTQSNKHYIIVGGMAQGVTEVTTNGR